jgi:hypothetical protein
LRTRAAAAQLDSVSTIRVWFSSLSALKRTARKFSAAGTLDLERENARPVRGPASIMPRQRSQPSGRCCCESVRISQLRLGKTLAVRRFPEAMRKSSSTPPQK